MTTTKHKIYSTVVPETKFVKEEELQEYLDGHWKLAGETTTTSFGANVMTESDTESEELTTKTDEEGNEVAELGASDERALELSNAPESMHVDPDSPTAQRWLTEVEREKLRQQDNPEQVEEMAKPEEEFWDDIQTECEELEEAAMAEDRKKSMERAVEGRDWLKPEHMTKKVSEMTGEEFAKVLNGDTPENVDEELVAEIAEAEAKVEADEEAEVDPEVAELAAESFESRAMESGKEYWADISESIRSEELGDVNSVRFSDIGEDTDIVRKQTDDDLVCEISTESEELQEEIRAVAKETDAKILRDGDRMLAEVRRSDVEEFNA